MSVKTKAAVALTLAVSAVSAHAATIYGGGATLPAIAYIGTDFFNAADPTHSVRLANPPEAGSLFATYTAKAFGAKKATVSYCQTGSGTGRNVLIGSNASNAPTLANGTCPDFSGTPTGFAAPTADPDFAASDAPLSAGEFQRGLTNKGATHTQLVQFPVLAGAVGVVYRNADAATRINLTTDNVCKIFSGQITNWNQLGLPTKAIKVIFRSDGSGTTFSFTNFLSANCTGAGFKTTGTFPGNPADLVNNGPAISPLPAGALGASGNPGVVNTVANTEGAIGYGEVADVELRKTASGGTLDYAKVNGFDPLANLKAPKYTKLVDKAINGNDGNGRPVTTTLSAPKAGCVIVADPNSYAKVTGSYPIVAITYLMAYATGNANAPATAALLKGPYTFGVKSNTTTVGTNTGFAFLSPSLSTTIGGCVK